MVDDPNVLILETESLDEGQRRLVEATRKALKFPDVHQKLHEFDVATEPEESVAM